MPTVGPAGHDLAEEAAMAQQATIVDRPSTSEARELWERLSAAIVGRDFRRLAACLDADVQMRALLPRAVRTATGPAETTGYFQQWFGTAERAELLGGGVDAVG